MKKRLTALFLFTTCILCHIAWGGEVPADLNLQVEGKAAISKNDVARAREEAVKNALENAILQTVEKLLGDKFEDKKFPSVKNALTGGTDQYVKTYRITSEKRQEDEYDVSVNASVSQAAVRGDLIRMNLLSTSKAASTSVLIVLKGLKNYSEFVRFKIFLQSRTPTIKSMYPCTLEWQKASCHLVTKSDLQTLASELEREGRYVVEVPENKPGGLELRLRTKEEVK